MLDQENAEAVALGQRGQDGADALALDPGEAGRRLVQYNTIRGSSASTMANSSACFLAMCKVARLGVQAFRQPGFLDDSAGRLPAARAGCRRWSKARVGPAGSGQRAGIPPTVRVANTLAAWNLRPIPSATQASGGQRPIVLPNTSISPPERSKPIGQAADQGRLAGAVGTDQAQEFALLGGEIDALQDLQTAESATMHATHDQAADRKPGVALRAGDGHRPA